MTQYPTDLTEKQWQVYKKRFRTARKETETSAQRDNISTHVETIEQLQDKIQTMQSDHHRELMKLEAKHQSELNRKEAVHTEETTRLKTSDIFRKAVNNIIRLARNYYKPCFDAEHVSDIKSVLNLFDDNKQPEISCISLPSKKGIWITGNESKLNGKPITWWREIMTSNKRGAFLCEDNN